MTAPKSPSQEGPVGFGARTRTSWLKILIITVTLLMLGSSTASGAFGINEFDGEVVNYPGPVAARQAGSHPDEASMTIELNRFEQATNLGPILMPDGGSVRDLSVNLPVGFVGNPTVTATCTDAQLMATDTRRGCSPDSQIGVVELRQNLGLDRFAPVYNMVPPDDAPAVFGFKVANVPVHLRARVRSATDMGLTVEVRGISQALPIYGTRVTLWGVPASEEHDALRGNCMNRNDGSSNGLCPSFAPRRAFLTNPTTCEGPVTTDLVVRSWRGDTSSSSFTTHEVGDRSRLIGAEGCGSLPFDVSLRATPQTPRAGSPSGYIFDITMPQSDRPESLAQSHLKKAVVRLPEGVAISPSSAGGLGACIDRLANFGTTSPPECPDSAKIGTAEIDTPLLKAPLNGAVYLLEPRPGNLFRLMIVAEGPGVIIKLSGEARPDKATGQVVATFDNNPELPFSNLRLVFKGGPRAPLVNPAACGTYTTVSEFTAWNGKTTSASSSFAITRDESGTPCPSRSFTPDFSAGLVNAAAGTSSTFSLTFGRDDDDPTLRDITVDLPAGLTGVIAQAGLCADGQAATGTCGEDSRIGSTTTGAGPGTNPFFLPGRVYLTGPYKGAPFGMSIVVPAVAGPFDLGTVVVRAAIQIDRRSAQLRVISDPLPTILEGVPLLLRRVNVAIDKPGFILAPTSCRQKAVLATIGSNGGGAFSASSRFQVGNCGALPYRPRISFSIGDRKHVRGGLTAPLGVTLTMPTGMQANNRTVEVTLPDNVNSRLAALRGACSIEEAAARTCLREAVVGNAVATTPLLPEPLTGPVYITRTPGNRLPNLWVALKGQGIGAGVDIDLVGRVRIVRGSLRLRTTFDEIPDVPVSRFTLRFVSGRQGPIGIIRGICSTRVSGQMDAMVRMRGQNGKLVAGDRQMKVAGCARARRTRRGSTESRKNRR